MGNSTEKSASFRSIIGYILTIPSILSLLMMWNLLSNTHPSRSGSDGVGTVAFWFLSFPAAIISVILTLPLKEGEHGYWSKTLSITINLLFVIMFLYLMQQ